jgi:hypothetical protein
MTTATTRLALPYPEAGDPNNVPGDIGALAARLALVGVGFAQGTARPAAGVLGRFYYDTNAGVLAYDDGTTWHNLTGTYPPFFQVSRSSLTDVASSQTIWTKMTGMSADENFGGTYDAGASRFTVPAGYAGIWDFVTNVYWDGPQQNPHLVQLLRNGAIQYYIVSDATGAGYSPQGLIQSGTRRIRLAVGDVMELRVRQEDNSVSTPRKVAVPEWSGLWLRP